MSDRFRGLSPRDTLVWSDALRIWPRLACHTVYGVRCGCGRHPEMHTLPLRALPGAADWQKRIDVVLVQGDSVVAVEVKPWGHSGAVGQALVYSALRAKDAGRPSPDSAVVICAHPDTDVLQVINTLSVGIISTDPPGYWGLFPMWLQSLLDSPSI